MLDERLEAKEYLSGKRVSIDRLTKNYDSSLKLIGLESMMTLIARDIMDTANEMSENNTVLVRELDSVVTRILQDWLGIPNSKTADSTPEVLSQQANIIIDKYKAYTNAVPKLYQAEKSKKKKGASNNRVDWDAYAAVYEKNLNSDFAYHGSAASYEGAFAMALQRGPLLVRYFAINLEIIESSLKDASRAVNADGSKKPPTAPSTEKFLKLIAAYLVLKENHPNQEYVTLDKTRVLNWLDIKDANFTNFINKFVYIADDGSEHRIFNREIVNSISKLTVDLEFLCMSGAKLIAERDIKEIGSGYTVYEDTGITKMKELKYKG